MPSETDSAANNATYNNAAASQTNYQSGGGVITVNNVTGGQTNNNVPGKQSNNYVTGNQTNNEVTGEKSSVITGNITSIVFSPLFSCLMNWFISRDATKDGMLVSADKASWQLSGTLHCY